MELSTLIEAVGPRSVRGRAELDITAVTYRAESAVPGALHACVPGFTADGHDFAGVAVANGAAALIVERELDVDVPQLVVASSRSAMAAAAATFMAALELKAGRPPGVFSWLPSVQLSLPGKRMLNDGFEIIVLWTPA